MQKTYIRTADNSDTVVLFIHGFLGSTEHFERFVARVPESISVYNVLLAGHGAGVSDFTRASMEEWKSQIENILSELADKYRKIYIVGHSMGTFFALDGAVKYEYKVKCIYLMQSPLKIGVKPNALANTFKSFFKVFENNEKVREYKKAQGVKFSLRVWEWVGLIPRYLELFGESKRARSTFLKVKTPCLVFQSKKDELVSMKSVKYIPSADNIKVNVLEKSEHFIYDREETEYLEKTFSDMISGKFDK